MSLNIYKVTKPDGTSWTGTMKEVQKKLCVKNVSACLRHRVKGCRIELLRPGSRSRKYNRRLYCLRKGAEILTGLTAGEAARILGIKTSNAVSAYARAGVPVNGYLVSIDNGEQLADPRFQRTAALFRCHECCFIDDDEGCRSHQCTKPQGYYTFIPAL